MANCEATLQDASTYGGSVMQDRQHESTCDSMMGATLSGASSDGNRSRSERELRVHQRLLRVKKDKKEKKEKKEPTGEDDKLDKLMCMVDKTNTAVASLSSNMSTCLGELTLIKTSFGEFQMQTETKFKEVSDELKEHARLIAELQQRGAAPAITNTPPNPATASDSFVPVGKRKVIFVGGFPEGTERAEIEKKLQEMTVGARGIEEVYATKKVGGNGKIHFADKDYMWNWLKARKGTRYDIGGKALFVSIDKTPDELKLASKVSKAVKTIKKFLEDKGTNEEEIKKRVDADYGAGLVHYKPSLDARFITVLRRPRGSTLLEVTETGHIEGLDLAAALSDFNGETA